MDTSDITQSETLWEDDINASVGETEEVNPNKSASQEQPYNNLPERTKAQFNAVKRVFRKDDAIFLLIEDVPIGVDLSVRFHDDESLVPIVFLNDVHSYVFEWTGKTDTTFGVKFKEVGNGKLHTIGSISVNDTLVSSRPSSSGTQSVASEDDNMPYDILPVRRREFSKSCPDEVDDDIKIDLHHSLQETETHSDTSTIHFPNKLSTTTKDDALNQQRTFGIKTDAAVTSTMSTETLNVETLASCSISQSESDNDPTMSLSPSTETLKADTLTNCSMPLNESDVYSSTMPLSPSTETLKAETPQSFSISKSELETESTMILSLPTETYTVEPPGSFSMSQSEIKADSTMLLGPSAETLTADALGSCSETHCDADSTMPLSHTAKPLTAETLVSYSMSQRELDADPTAEPLATCSTSHNELEAESFTNRHYTIDPMLEKSPTTAVKHHQLIFLLQDELARVNHAFNDYKEVVLRSKAARTSVRTDSERKTVYPIIEEELSLSDTDGHAVVADDEELSLSDTDGHAVAAVDGDLSLSDTDGHAVVVDDGELSLSDTDVHAVVAENKESPRPCSIEERDQQSDGVKGSVSAEASIYLPADEILITSNNCYAQEAVDQNPGKYSKKHGFSFKRQIKKIIHKSNSEPKMVAVVNAAQKREKTKVCKSNSDFGTKEMAHAASTGGLFVKNEALQEECKKKGKGKKMTPSKVQRKPSVRIQRVLEDENIFAPALPLKPTEDTQ